MRLPPAPCRGPGVARSVAAALSRGSKGEPGCFAVLSRQGSCGSHNHENETFSPFQPQLLAEASLPLPPGGGPVCPSRSSRRPHLSRLGGPGQRHEHGPDLSAGHLGLYRLLLDDGNKDFALKRIIGLPGETVYLRHGYIYINGQVLLEPYLPKYTYTFASERAAVFVLGDEQYFVLGDNRPASADSRIYGPVDRDQIKRRIPLPAGTLRAHLGQYTLPNYTDLVSRHPVQKLDTAESSF
ncbi:MAG: signal peptidase I [Verrucomicrobia bacterium]|nr:MAG: signal peptidase I [Verrucomicrobiota bacterium]